MTSGATPPPRHGSQRERQRQARAAVPTALADNIKSLLARHNDQASQRTFQARIADAITWFAGSLGFIWLHVAWFGLWIVMNTHLPGMPGFDPFPFGLMTTIVSLEAIFLSAFVLLSQNRMQSAADRRAELDLHINLLAERESTLILAKLARIERHLGIHVDDSEAQLTADLSEPVDAVEVLAEIERAT